MRIGVALCQAERKPESVCATKAAPSIGTHMEPLSPCPGMKRFAPTSEPARQRFAPATSTDTDACDTLAPCYTDTTVNTLEDGVVFFMPGVGADEIVDEREFEDARQLVDEMHIMQPPMLANDDEKQRLQAETVATRGGLHGLSQFAPAKQPTAPKTINNGWTFAAASLPLPRQQNNRCSSFETSTTKTRSFRDMAAASSTPTEGTTAGVGTSTSRETAGPATHEQHVLETKERRDLSDRMRQLWMKQQHKGADFEKLQSQVAEFVLPGGSWSSGQGRVIDSILHDAEKLIADYRCAGTWRRYLPSWRFAQILLTKWLQEDKHLYVDQYPFWGLNARTLRLPEARDYLVAVVAHKFQTSETATGVATMSHALNLMLTINSIEVNHDFRTKVVKQVAKRLRTKAVKKMAGLSFEEAKQINAKWGKHKQRGKRMLSLAVCLGFVALLRFADLAVINIGGIFFTDEGVLICVPVRKNAQIYPTWIAVADTHKPDSVVQRLKDMITELGHTVPLRGCINTCEYLFRDIVTADNYTHEHRRTDVLRPGDHGGRSLTKLAYDHYKSRFRAALEQCCGMTKTAARLFGMHSMRSGGDTHLFNMGFSSQARRDIGGWATDLVERGYLRMRCKQMFDLARQAGL
jgi:hypothetical protein